MPLKQDPEELRSRLTGPIGSVRTPFDREGAIDFRALRRMVDLLVEADSSAVMLTYGDSLFSVLTDEEVGEVTRAVVEQVAGRAVTIAADRGWWTGKAVLFGEFAREAGADILMLMPPVWGDSVTPETLADHYAAVAGHIPVMMVTNVFAGMGTRGMTATIQEVLTRVPGVIAVKDDLCEEAGRRLSLQIHGRMAVIAGGQKQNHLNAWPYGCDAYLSAFITFHPAVAHGYWSAVQQSDIARMKQIIAEIDNPFFDYILALPGGFDAGIHGVLELYGLAQRWRRPPFRSLAGAEMEALSQFLCTLKLP